MSTKQSQAKKVVAPNAGGEEDNDLGVLIYRESQLRNVEAAATVESKKTSTALIYQQTSTWKRTAVNQGQKSLHRPQSKNASKGRKLKSLSKED